VADLKKEADLTPFFKEGGQVRFFEALDRGERLGNDTAMRKMLLMSLTCSLLIAAAPKTTVDHPGLRKLGWQQAARASTFREMTVYDMIDLLHEMDVHHIQLSPGQALSPEKKDVKIGPAMSAVDIDALLAKLKPLHMDIVSYGIADFGSSPDDARKVFEFGKKLKLKTFVTDAPKESLEMLDKLATDYSINVAITTDTPGNRYKMAEDALDAVKARSNRIGICADLAAWRQSRQLPADCVEKLAGHVLLVNLRNAEDPDMQAGHVLAALKAQGFKGIICVQDESESPEQRLQGFAKSVNAFNVKVTELAK
jgi:sugar phosphate isomerase/epimerase